MAFTSILGICLSVRVLDAHELNEKIFCGSGLGIRETSKQVTGSERIEVFEIL